MVSDSQEINCFEILQRELLVSFLEHSGEVFRKMPLEKNNLKSEQGCPKVFAKIL